MGEALSRKTARIHLSSDDLRKPLSRLLTLQGCVSGACGAFFRPFSLSPLFLEAQASSEPRLRRRCDAVGVGRKTWMFRKPLAFFI